MYINIKKANLTKIMNQEWLNLKLKSKRNDKNSKGYDTAIKPCT